MNTGILGQAIVDKRQPNAKDKLVQFLEQVKSAQTKQGVPLVVCLTKRLDEHRMEVIFLPASGHKGKLDDLKTQGFAVAEPVSDVSQVSFNIEAGSAQTSFSLFED